MNNYQILTDSGSDLSQTILDELNVKRASLTVNFKGQTLADSVDEGIKDIYDGLRAGAAATTSAINPENWKDAMEPSLKEGKDLLVIAFSSGLSTTYQSAVIAANELMETYPDRQIRVVDSLCASLGQGLLVWYAAKKRDEGLSLDALTAWLEENKLHLCHWFTVDELSYLKRGGRVSAATALVGTMLNIKPVMRVDNEGHLVKFSTARGRKASIKAMADKLGETGIPGANDTCFICHGDCIEDAQLLANIIKEQHGVKEVHIGYTGAVIGSHSGPGTLALFFLGNQR
ncbi:MAG: DegV family protein [Ruminococcaceae bacterium]|nr:DegV family protein [Oscillospiraceae bacterium]